jgi:hypothetical protein
MKMLVPQPVCKNCSVGTYNPQPVDGYDRIISHFPNVKNWIHIALACSSLALLAIGLFFHFRFKIDLLIIPFGISLFLQIPVALLLRSKTKAKTNRSITRAQVDSLFKTSGEMTIKRLASATGASEKAASEFLNDMVRNNELVVSSNESELIYRLPKSIDN